MENEKGLFYLIFEWTPLGVDKTEWIICTIMTMMGFSLAIKGLSPHLIGVGLMFTGFLTARIIWTNWEPLHARSSFRPLIFLLTKSVFRTDHLRLHLSEIIFIMLSASCVSLAVLVSPWFLVGTALLPTWFVLYGKRINKKDGDEKIWFRPGIPGWLLIGLYVSCATLGTLSSLSVGALVIWPTTLLPIYIFIRFILEGNQHQQEQVDETEERLEKMRQALNKARSDSEEMKAAHKKIVEDLRGQITDLKDEVVQADKATESEARKLVNIHGHFGHTFGMVCSALGKIRNTAPEKVATADLIEWRETISYAVIKLAILCDVPDSYLPRGRKESDWMMGGIRLLLKEEVERRKGRKLPGMPDRWFQELSMARFMWDEDRRRLRAEAEQAARQAKQEA
jgi:hypothetical protein